MSSLISMSVSLHYTLYVKVELLVISLIMIEPIMVLQQIGLFAEAIFSDASAIGSNAAAIDI